ncbi:UEV-domain-containing protein [Martensiomyces pterosporus]|nr:UEV-domain-containing protein [Martensiomyces pterosporus]
MDLEPIRQWLSVITKQKFSDSQRVYALVDAALTQHRSLQPKVAEYVAEDGIKQGLLCLHGTLPVPFHGSVFNIPVVFWFPLQFPSHPPLAYVTPTRTMVVKASRYVDERGRVYHPYLADWADQSTLNQLFENLIAVFSAEPPVYSRPPGQVASASSPLMAQQSPTLGSTSMASLHPPPATSTAASTPATQSSAFVRPLTSVESDLASVVATVASNPSLAAYRIQKTEQLNASVESNEQGLAQVATEHHQTQAASTTAPGTTHPSYKFNPVAGRPPIPTLSPVVATNKPGFTSRPVSQELASSNTSSGVSWASERQSSASSTLSHIPNIAAAATATASNEHTSSDEVQQETRRQSQGAVNGQENRLSTAESAASTTDEQPAQAPASPVTTAVPISTPPPTTTAARVSAIPAKAASPPRSSLLDTDPVDDPQKRLVGYQLAIFDRVFEAVKRSSEKHAKMNKELLDQSANLNSGAGVIAEERRQLSESQRQLEVNIRVLEDKVAELQGKKTEFPDAQRISDVKQVFRGQTPAMEQLFDLAGEISAIDDTLYYLGKALDDGKLSLNTYMRQVRKLSQQQFMAKALAIKIRRLCSLDG